MKRTDTYIKLIVGVLFLALIAYIISWIFQSKDSGNIVTAEVVKITEYESENVDGIAVREESLLTTNKPYISVQKKDGESVAKGSVIAIATNSEEALEKANHVTELTQEIADYEKVISNAASAISATSKEDKINDTVKSLASAIATGNMSELEGDSLIISALVFENDALEESEKRLEDLQAELESYSENDKDESTVKAPVAGIFTTNVDGYEGITSDDLDNLTVLQLKNIQDSKTDTDTGVYGKIISSFDWNFAATVSKEFAEKLSENMDVKLKFEDYYSESIPAKVVSISEEANGECAVVFSLKRAEAETVSMRESAAEIIISEEDGLRIPLKAMHVDDNGDKYVYRVTANQLEKITVEILQTCDDYYLVAESDEDGLREGSIIVVSGADLYEGKVIES